MKHSKKKASITKQCVACGCCVKVCPSSAIAVHMGICAVIDEKKCVGCGKCVETCPASVISVSERGSVENEAKALV